MKKLVYILLMFIIAFSACDPNEDIYDELDTIIEPYHTTIDYLFTADDYSTASKAALLVATNKSDSSYAKSIANDLAFNEVYPAANLVGPVLAANFPALNLNSVARVTYNIETGTPEAHLPFLNAEDYELTTADYNSVGGLTEIKGYFIPSSTPEDNLPAILANSITSPEADDIVFVKYKYYDTEPIDSLSSFELFGEDFESYAAYDTINLNGWSNFEEVGTRAWLARSYSGNTYAQFSSNSSGEENVAWMISPEIELSVGVDNKLSFDVTVGYYTHEGLTVLISEDFDGSDVAGATWDDVTDNFTLPTEPVSGYGTATNAGTLTLSDYSGNIHIAFKYNGDGANSLTTTYQIDNVVIISGVADPSDKYNVYYEYTGSAWVVSDGAYALNPVDYDEMGAPGAYGNFSSSVAPENYIPQFLASKYPYAQEGDVMTISYKYYSGGTITMLDDYKFESGKWTLVNTIVEKTEQYVYSNIGWVFDPTVKFTMNSANYQFIVDYVKNNISPDYIDKYGTADSYYGASAYYSEFTISAGSWDSSVFDTWEEAVEEAIGTVLLPELYPNAVLQVNGVDLFYHVSFLTYNSGTMIYYVMKFQVTKAGPSPEFTLAEEPTAI